MADEQHMPEGDATPRAMVIDEAYVWDRDSIPEGGIIQPRGNDFTITEIVSHHISRRVYIDPDAYASHLAAFQKTVDMINAMHKDNALAMAELRDRSLAAAATWVTPQTLSVSEEATLHRHLRGWTPGAIPLDITRPPRQEGQPQCES